ncbi:uncharacterized protein [Henckelia pumila]|uniref:uncharacterized protein n=1 Tax=Henckelia pumila TaxID=405737 RepID=UPI003C6E5DE2
MGKQNIVQMLIFLLNLGTLLISLACPTCPYQTPLPPKHPPFVKPPPSPTKPPVVTPSPSPPPYVPINPPPYIPKPPPIVYPPIKPEPPVVPNPPPYVAKPPPIVYPPIKPEPPVVPNPPPYVAKPPPIVYPPIKPEPPIVPEPPIKPPPIETPCPPPPPPKAKETCPINTLKLGACVDLLGSLGHLIIGSSAKDTCCPVLEGLVDADAALCLCTTIKAKLLNINIILPIALEVLVDCGKTPPAGFQCPA